MSKLIMLRGLPASGKSTWAKEQVDGGDGRVVRVNKDDLRAMIDNSKWSRGREESILDIRDRIISYYLVLGKTVIVDDTNLDPKHEKGLIEIVDTFNKEYTKGNLDDHRVAVEFEIKDFDIDVDECILRDAGRPNPVGKKVILDMYNRYIKPRQDKMAWEEDLKDCYIFDIDGTLALMNGRSPYEWDKVGTDKVNEPVRNILDLLYSHKTCIAGEFDVKRKYDIIIVSGRDSSCMGRTQEWLNQYCIYYDYLYMRPEGDMRKDSIVKEEIYRQNIGGKYNVLGIFDDREQVVKMWRKLGLPVFQVEEGRF